MQHHRRILADRIEHHRPLAFGDDLAQDVNALRLEPIEMAERLGRQRIHRELSGADPRVKRPVRTDMQAALFLLVLLPPPAAGALALAGLERARAGRAADGEKAHGVQLIDGHAERLGRGDDALARVIGERIELDELALDIELDEIDALARLRLIGAQPGHPGGDAGEQARERLHLAHMAAGLAILDRAIETIDAMLGDEFRERQSLRIDRVNAPRVAGLRLLPQRDRLLEETAGVDGHDIDLEALREDRMGDELILYAEAGREDHAAGNDLAGEPQTMIEIERGEPRRERFDDPRLHATPFRRRSRMDAPPGTPR